MSKHSFVVLIALTLSMAVVASQPRSLETPRLDKLKEWLRLVDRHQPGNVDAAAVSVRSWDRLSLQDLRDDLCALRLMICALYTPPGRDPRCAPPPANVGGNQQLPSNSVLRMNKGSRDWAGLYPRNHLIDLGNLAGEVDRRGINDILKRGALLHTDVALRAPPATTWAPAGPMLFLQKTSVHVADGRQSGVHQSVDHLDMARRLLDIVTPDPRRDPDTYPERDPMVQDWYRATMAFLLDGQRLDLRHEAVSRETFPSDAEVLFLAGALHETLASSHYQNGVETRSLSMLSFIESERVELARAEQLFRWALKNRPTHVEARLRLGQVLAQRGRSAEALVEIRSAADAARDPLLSYYAALFIGREESDVDRARTAFQHAAALYPRAQSPYLGLSELEMRSGNKLAAARALDVVWASSTRTAADDPWSFYYQSAGRSAAAQLQAIGAEFPPRSAP